MPTVNDPDGQHQTVDGDHLAHSLAVGFSEQRFQSEVKGEAYQVWGISDDASGAEQPVLFLKNIDTTGKILIVMYIRCIALNLATTGSFGPTTYFTVGFDQAFASAGTAVVPINMNRSAGHTATVEAYSGASTLVLAPTANAAVADRHYPEASMKEHVWRKEGSIVLKQGRSITLSMVTDFTTGTCYGRISFIMAEPFRS